MIIDFKEVDNIVMGGIDTADYPDFADAHIESADYKGKQATEEELDLINEEYDFVYDNIITSLM